MSQRRHCYTWYRLFGIIVGLLLLIFPGTGTCAQEERAPTEDMRPRRASQQLAIVVHGSRLSVEVQDADLGEVLAQIGEQAGIRISSGPSAGKKVSARFADVELEAGIRRLLRLASLSHIFLYASGPVGAITIAEVRVLGEGKEAISHPAALDQPGVPSPDYKISAPTGKARRRSSEVVEPVQELTPELEQAEPSELTRRVREVFQLGKEMENRISEAQESSPNETR